MQPIQDGEQNVVNLPTLFIYIISIPKHTIYKNKWAIQIFREWQGQRANKICTTELGEVFKGEDIGLDVQELIGSIENKNAKSLNYCLCKFV